MFGLNDFYMLDPETDVWTDLSLVAQGTPPKPRGGHGFTSSNGRLYVFGGTKGDDFGTAVGHYMHSYFIFSMFQRS